MIINGKVNGVELPVEVDDEVIAQIRSDAVDSFIRCLITVKADDITSYEDALTDEEFDELVEFVTERSASVWDYLADEIITGKFAKTVEEEYDKIIQNRVKFYRVEGTVTIPVNFIVRATSENEAREFVCDIRGDEFDDELQWCDSEVTCDYITDVTDEGYSDNDPHIFDATE